MSKKLKYNVFNTNEFESHMLAFDIIKNNSKVLDIGCATGYMSRKLHLEKKCEMWGVDNNPDALKLAKKYCKKVILQDLNEMNELDIPQKHFDHILILDVIEHLVSPEKILKLMRKYLKKTGSVIISVPNVAHASIRLMLLRGEFNYSNLGIMDKTHVHFYTRETLKKLLINMGYKIIKIIPTNGMCKVPFLYLITDRLPQSWQYKLVKRFPTLFAFQFMVEARCN